MEDHHGHIHTFVYCTNGRLICFTSSPPTDKKTASTTSNMSEVILIGSWDNQFEICFVGEVVTGGHFAGSLTCLLPFQARFSFRQERMKSDRVNLTYIYLFPKNNLLLKLFLDVVSSFHVDNVITPVS